MIRFFEKGKRLVRIVAVDTERGEWFADISNELMDVLVVM